GPGYPVRRLRSARSVLSLSVFSSLMNGSALAARRSDHPARVGEGNPEPAAGFAVFHQRQVRLVGFTPSPGQVQAKAGAAFVGGEKRFEHGVAVFRGNTGA